MCPFLNILLLKSYILSFVRNSGSNDMITLRENRAAYSRLRLLPKILIDVSKVSTGTTMYICVYKYMFVFINTNLEIYNLSFHK
jgi:hypothetical protein